MVNEVDAVEKTAVLRHSCVLDDRVNFGDFEPRDSGVEISAIKRD